MDMNKTVSELAKSVSRALSTLYTKVFKSWDVFQKLYETLVEPVMFYIMFSSGEARTFKEIQSVQNKACRFFFPSGDKCASKVTLRDYMGWNSCFVKAKIEVCRLYIE